MIQIDQENLISGESYYIASYGPNGIIAKMLGIYCAEGPNLMRFNDVIQYKNGEKINIGWFHAPTILSSDGKTNYYWKYFIPSNPELIKKVKTVDIEVILTKMLLIRQAYNKRIGDPSTIMGMIHRRFGLDRKMKK